SVRAANRGVLAEIEPGQGKGRGAQGYRVRETIGDGHYEQARQQVRLIFRRFSEDLYQQHHRAQREYVRNRHDSHENPEVAAVVIECPVQQLTQAQWTYFGDWHAHFPSKQTMRWSGAGPWRARLSALRHDLARRSSRRPNIDLILYRRYRR